MSSSVDLTTDSVGTISDDIGIDANEPARVDPIPDDEHTDPASEHGVGAGNARSESRICGVALDAPCKSVGSRSERLGPNLNRIRRYFSVVVVVVIVIVIVVVVIVVVGCTFPHRGNP